MGGPTGTARRDLTGGDERPFASDQCRLAAVGLTGETGMPAEKRPSARWGVEFRPRWPHDREATQYRERMKVEIKE